MSFLGWLSDPFQWLSDLQLGDEKVTLNHLLEALPPTPIVAWWLLGGLCGNFSSVKSPSESHLLLSLAKPTEGTSTGAQFRNWEFLSFPEFQRFRCLEILQLGGFSLTEVGSLSLDDWKICHRHSAF